ncbi:hypothetical protein ACOSP7_023585 [Xanthoceras sorbifolium]
MMQLAKLLHSKGFHVTFVNTEFNHNRLIRFKGLDALKGLLDFRFETIPDGLPPSDRDATQDIRALCDSTTKNCLVPLVELVGKLNSSAEVPPVSCMVSDGVMSFAIKAAEIIGIPEVQFWTTSACGFMGYLQFAQLIKREIFPFKDENFLRDGTLDKPIDWVPGMSNIRHFHYFTYVNYGSITVMTEEHLKEFAWGLANSNHPFLRIVRPDVVMGIDSVILPEEYFEEIKDRGLIVNWCPQEKVFHIQQWVISAGVPVICWPFFAEQQTNCRYACTTWGIGMEVNHDVRDIENLVKKMLEEEDGKKMRENAIEWKKKAVEATDIGGKSSNNFDKFIEEALLCGPQ